MTLYPGVQKKAQAEIDAVVGPDRLPSFSDRNSLPYIEALVKEVLRWNVAAPTGIFIYLIAFFTSLTEYQYQALPIASYRTTSTTGTLFLKTP